jgi:hypothetical protein
MMYGTQPTLETMHDTPPTRHHSELDGGKASENHSREIDRLHTGRMVG